MPETMRERIKGSLARMHGPESWQSWTRELDNPESPWGVCPGAASQRFPDDTSRGHALALLAFIGRGKVPAGVGHLEMTMSDVPVDPIILGYALHLACIVEHDDTAAGVKLARRTLAEWTAR